MAKTYLPPGFRFHPTDVELVKFYLKRKVMGRELRFDAIAEVDIYKHTPWDLPEKSCLRSGDLKWYFFCPREKKYANGARTNRATEFGYWKITGKDRPFQYNNEVVGMIKTLVFHRGKAPRGDRTDWVMHEYRIQENNLAERGIVQFLGCIGEIKFLFVHLLVEPLLATNIVILARTAIFWPESEISTDELYTGQNCYILELLSYQVNPCSSNSPPMLPEAPPRFEDQLALSVKENSGWGNVEQTPLDNGAAALFKQLSEGNSHASENPNRGGSNYPW